MQPQQAQTRTQATTFDAGLQAHFRRVYNTVSLGLVVTGLMAYIVASTEGLLQFFYGNAVIHFIVMLAPLGIIFFGFTPNRLLSMSMAQVTGLFVGFSALMGISLAYIFQIYSGASIARVFFITSAMFAAMSIYGYTTKKDLAAMGSFMFMGLIGLIIASLVNLFMRSSALDFAISGIGVIVFTGLIAWDTQRIKETYSAANGSEMNGKLAVSGALSLYLNFINLFLMLLRLFGNNRS